MPLQGDKVITAEQAIAAHLCPECGRSLKETNAIAELNAHWRTEPPNGIDGDEARKRRALLKKYIQDNNVQTSDQIEAAAAATAAAPTTETLAEKRARLLDELDDVNKAIG